MTSSRLHFPVVILAAGLLALFARPAVANTWCVNPSGAHGCFKHIQDAVNAASANDVIQVEAGTYKEYVTIGKPLSILGVGANQPPFPLPPMPVFGAPPMPPFPPPPPGGASVVDATGFPHGFFVDGFDHPGLNNVTIAGFTVETAVYEGILVVNASDVTISNNNISNNDTSSGLSFTGAAMGCPDQPGNGQYETDETGDCGGALHLVGTKNSTVSGNFMTGNADGILISDDSAESSGNLLIHNTLLNNPLECGIVLASHDPAGSSAPYYAAHHGVRRNTVAENISIGNGVQVEGAGVGLFSDGLGPGTVSGNVVVGNTLIHNGLGGVTLHSHAGPAFSAPADDMDGNKIIGNFIADNLADTADTATPGTVGINISSGGGGSPVTGTLITLNTIQDEAFDIAVNTPAEVDIHLNNLLGGNVGVGNVCNYDYTLNSFSGASTYCNATTDATENFWGCATGPGGKGGCSGTYGSNINFTPWLSSPAFTGNQAADNSFGDGPRVAAILRNEEDFFAPPGHRRNC
jgi:Right handed beta helix region